MTDDWKKDAAFFDSLLAKDVSDYALYFVRTGNTADAKLFFQGLENANRNEAKTQETVAQTFLHTLLLNDQLGMVQTLVDDDQIHYWCGNNQRHVINECAQLFSWWEHPRKWERVAEVLNGLEDEQKVEVLRGCGTTVAQKYFYDALKVDPRKWEKLAPVWIGCDGSSMRQAAVDLGWDLGMVKGMMMHESWEDPINEWRGVTPYPYSTYLLLALASCENPSEHDNYGHIRFVKTLNEIQNDHKVHPLDAALTAVLVDRAPQVNAAFTGRGPCRIQNSVARVTKEQRSYLAHLVDVHMALEALPHLTMMVLRDDVMGMMEQDNTVLPEMGMQPIRIW